MRYFKIFSLQFQEVLMDRSRILVWFIIGAVSPLILILFWRGTSIAGWTSAEISSYYLFVILVGAFVMCHHEEHIGLIDIKEGGLTAYLLKPFSYFWLKFFNEMPYRIIQAGNALVLLALFLFFFPSLFVFVNEPVKIIFAFFVLLSALALTFLFKTIIGLLSFWMTEGRGAFEAVEVTLAVFSGTLMPLALMPHWIEQLAYALPFAYMIYFPILALEGKLATNQLWQVLGIQFVWICIFFLLYKKLWREGIKQYTALGQ